MKYKFKPAKNPRVLIIQKVYGNRINNDQNIIFENNFDQDIVLKDLHRSMGL